MPTPEVVVRPPADGPERDAYVALAATQFMRDAPPERRAADLARFLRETPGGIAPRCAFADGEMLGGYLFEARRLRVGPARIPAGCVGTVVVRPDRRRGGIGRALMLDSLAFGRDSGLAMLLLNGAANYYQPFGYADVFDATDHAVRRDDALALPPGPCRVREATAADAEALRDLYDRHCGPHPGSYERDAAQTAFLARLGSEMTGSGYSGRDGLPFTPVLVALDADDRIRGYRCQAWGPLRAFGDEVAADDWPATLALLRDHAERLAALGEGADRVVWPLPPDALAAQFLADHLTVEQTTVARPRANWEASVVAPGRLLEAMVPAWDARWRASGSAWQGTLALALDGETLALRLGPDGVSPAHPAQPTVTVSLASQVMSPLLFGFRSLAWARQHEGQSIPDEAVPLLETLFPPQVPWIAPTDGC